MVNKIKKIMMLFGEYPCLKVVRRNHTEFELLKIRYRLRSKSNRNVDWYCLD